MVIVHYKTKGKLTTKEKIIKAILDRLTKDVSKKAIEAEKRRLKYLEKNKLTPKELKEWAKRLPHHKQEMFSLGATLAGSAPVVVRSGFSKEFTKGAAVALTPYIMQLEPYAIPLMATGIGTALAYDLWHLKEKQIRAKLKKLGKWTDKEIDWIISHIKRHKKKNPKLMHNIKRHHAAKLKRIM